MMDSKLGRASAVALLMFTCACGSTGNRGVDADAVPIGPAPPTLNPAAEAAPRTALPTEPRSGSASSAPRVPGASDAAADALNPTGAVAWPRTVGGAQSGSLAIARVGGRDILLTDLVSKWILRDPDGVRAILDDLVLSRIVTMESGALGIELPPGAIDKVVRERTEALAERAKKAGAPDIATYVKARLGKTPESFQEELVNEAAVDLLAPRCVRAWLLATERRNFRVIAVETDDAARSVQQRLDAGEDFGEIARDVSTDASKSEGGRMPPVVRGDQALARTAFAAELGTVTGPIEDGQGFVFMQVEAEPKVIEGPWSDVAERVEQSLLELPVEDPEFWQWKDAMFRRHEIDISAFLRLAGG